MMVTKTFLPPLEEYVASISSLWESHHIANNGENVQQLEAHLKDRFEVPYLFLVSNATIGLQVVIKALGLTKQVITTPFSYVATTSSLVWQGCNPVFVDIDPHSLCIDPEQIESAISDETEAILATHVYGIPCDVKAIEELSKQHNLPVIYDAAHTFDVQYKNKPLISYGSASVISFHATKVFHTIEGGAIATHDPELATTIEYMRNFGHKGHEAFAGVGINAKMNEFQAAMGLVNLNHIDKILEHLRVLHYYYHQFLAGLNLEYPTIPEDTLYNYSYFPVIFNQEKTLKKVKALLESYQIFPRRYFYPSLEELPYVTSKTMKYSSSISRRVLCLPLSFEMTKADIQLISSLVAEGFNGK